MSFIILKSKSIDVQATTTVSTGYASMAEIRALLTVIYITVQFLYQSFKPFIISEKRSR